MGLFSNIGKKITSAVRNAQLSIAESRANAKIARLQRNGVRTGSINPIKAHIDKSDAESVRRYTADLKQFNSRKTQYVAGADGTPLPAKLFKEYTSLVKKWNKEHLKFWRNFGSKKVITSQGAQDMTVAQSSATTTSNAGYPFGGVNYQRSVEPEKIKSVADLRRRMQIIRNELSPAYQAERMNKLRDNLDKAAQVMNDKELSSSIQKLTPRQLAALSVQSNFVEVLYAQLNEFYKAQSGEYVNDVESSAMTEHLKQTLANIEQAYPA
jgi:hypothetical protein